MLVPLGGKYYSRESSLSACTSKGMKHSIGQLTFCENRKRKKKKQHSVKIEEKFTKKSCDMYGTKAERLFMTSPYRQDSISSFKTLAMYWAIDILEF